MHFFADFCAASQAYTRNVRQEAAREYAEKGAKRICLE